MKSTQKAVFYVLNPMRELNHHSQSGVCSILLSAAYKSSRAMICRARKSAPQMVLTTGSARPVSRLSTIPEPLGRLRGRGQDPPRRIESRGGFAMPSSLSVEIWRFFKKFEGI
jgi:hypothetical protein